MAASHSSYYYLISHSKFPFPIHNHFHPQTHTLMFSFFFFFFATFSIFFFFFLSVHRKSSKRKTEQPQEEEQKPPPTHQTRSLSSIDPSEKTGEPIENESAHLTRSLLLEVLPADSPKWQTLFKAEKAGACCGGGDPESDPFGLVFAEKGGSGGDQRAKKKKKRNRRKSSNSNGGCQEEGDSGPGCCRDKQEVVCLYPFTSSSSMTQRKIKQQYEELMKCYHAKGLTLAQVGQFANCLVEARNELQHKADVIQRKFTITKALLFKADRSSFDRLRQQIYKLELEQKRLEEDAYVYNWLQQRLKVSPAYKKMLEVGALMEMKAKSGELTESTDDECSDISFEELLAQEKKDSFWQRNGKLRSCSS